MRTLDLVQAAAFLRLSPKLLRRRAAAGLIRAAKPGKRWVFLEDDLADYLARLYAASRQAPRRGSKPELDAWASIDAAKCGGFGSPRQAVSEYESLLGLRTSDPRKNSTTG